MEIEKILTKKQEEVVEFYRRKMKLRKMKERSRERSIEEGFVEDTIQKEVDRLVNHTNIKVLCFLRLVTQRAVARRNDIDYYMEEGYMEEDEVFPVGSYKYRHPCWFRYVMATANGMTMFGNG